jgi:hypothetical protein
MLTNIRRVGRGGRPSSFVGNAPEARLEGHNQVGTPSIEEEK